MRISDWSSDVCSSDLLCVEEQRRVLHEKVGVLEMGAVPRVRIEDELRVRDMLRERVRVDRRDHHIVAAVHDQRRLADPLQLGEAVVARAKPGLHRRELRTDCLHPGRDVVVLGAAMAPLPERSEEHTSELKSLMRTSYAGFCLQKKKKN